MTGAILLVSGSSSTSSTQTFDVFNSTVGADDVVVINPLALDEYNVWISRVFAGGFQVSFQTSGTTVEQPVFKFAVIKAASS